ncbi:hypothetical protein BC936DRAFT_145194 [Jimgerdemannia flammicorona]|uniref:Uncharacterized protein n=1 Tax=Jimgerdemannia flammicorona TaxID=994334 RepID=A0A433DAP0_9FUNG|nr:hypothetical protein BC936DRAFT_145194 [Jimgerdemannia flammicorona]
MVADIFLKTTPESATHELLPAVTTQLGSNPTDPPETVSSSEVRWKKRALDLSGEVERLRRKLCLTEEVTIYISFPSELTKTRLSLAAKKRKPKKPTEEEQHASSSAGTPVVVPTPPSSASVRRDDDGALAILDPDCRAFVEVTRDVAAVADADGEEDEDIDEDALSTFDLLQAMSFLHEFRALHHATSKLAPDTPAVPNPERSRAISQTMIRLLGFVTTRTDRVVRAFWEGTRAQVVLASNGRPPDSRMEPARMRREDVMFCLDKVRAIAGKVLTASYRRVAYQQLSEYSTYPLNQSTPRRRLPILPCPSLCPPRRHPTRPEHHVPDSDPGHFDLRSRVGGNGIDARAHAARNSNHRDGRGRAGGFAGRDRRGAGRVV